MKKKLVGLLTIIILLTSAIGCSNSNGKAIAKFEGGEVSYEYFLKKFALLKYQLEHFYGKEIWEVKEPNSDKTMLESIKNDLLEKTVTDRIVLNEAKKQGITADSKTVNEILNSTINALTSDESAKKYYEINGIDKNFLNQIITEDLTLEQYRLKYLEGIDVTDEKIQEEYENNKSLYNNEEVKASHILLSTLDEKGNDMPEEKQIEIKAKIDNIYNQLLNGADFVAMAKEYSEDGSASSGGDLGFFPRGVMVPEFEDAAFSLEVGQISQPVKSKFGYHIIKVTDKKSEDINDEEVKDLVKNTLLNKEYSKMVDKLVVNNNYETDKQLLENLEKDIKDIPIEDTQGNINKTPKEDNKEENSEN